MAKGNHIYVKREGYTHHGIDIGKGWVIHYTGDIWQKITKQSKHSIRKDKKSVFAGKSKIHVVSYTSCHSVQKTINMAHSRLGEKKYDLIFNNCEHFATWCKTGKSRSKQVEKAVAIPTTATAGATVAVATATTAAVVGLGPVAGVVAGTAAIGKAVKGLFGTSKKKK